MVQKVKPYIGYLGDSWLERKTIPYWVKAFKTLGIYDEDYHEKYRKYLHSERYMTYINLVEKDIREKIEAVKKENIDKLFEEKFGKDFTCPST